MNEKVDYIIFESALARLERQNKRLFILCLVIFLAFVASNMAWVVYENQFEDTTVTQEVDTGEGNANVIGVGDYYGEN